MGRIIPLNGETFTREGSVRPQHYDTTHEQYGPQAMSQAIQAGMLALEAGNKIGTPIAQGIMRATESTSQPEGVGESKESAPVVEPVDTATANDAAVARSKAEYERLSGNKVMGTEGRRLYEPSVADATRQALGNDLVGGMVAPEVEQSARAQMATRARQAAATQAVGSPATPEDKFAFDTASAQRSLDQGQRSVDRYTNEQGKQKFAGEVTEAAVKAARDTYTRQLAAAQSLNLPAPAMPEILKAKPVMATPAQEVAPVSSVAMAVDNTFAKRLESVTDIDKLKLLSKRLPDEDARQKLIAKRMEDLSVEQTFNPKDEAKFSIDPKRIYNYNELENLAHQIARGGGTAQDRRNLLEAFQRSDGRGVSIGSLSDLLSGEHVSRAGDRLSDILKSGIPRKTEEELAIERAYKMALGTSALARGNAAETNASTNAEVKPQTADAQTSRAASSQQNADTNQALQLGTGRFAPAKGEQAGGLLGVAQGKLNETIGHDYATEALALENLGDYTKRGSLANYRDRMAATAAERAAKATGDKEMTPYQKAQLGRAEVVATYDDSIREHMSNISKAESILLHPVNPPGDEPSPYMPEHKDWVARNAAYLGWKKAKVAAQNAIQSEQNALDTDRQSKQKAMKGIVEGAGGVSRGNTTTPRNSTATPAPSKAPVAAPAEKLTPEQIRKKFSGE